MGKSLIIVESPAKVKTIEKFLGSGYIVRASVGHVRDLPSKTIGVDEAHDFTPHYEIIAGKEKIVDALRNAAAKADVVYLAPDPDREGEAIAWHIAELLKDEKQKIQRIQFNEITAQAVHNALEHPRSLNEDLFDAQQARRVLDRLVGYKISPLLWKTVKRGISAGRVQSVALRLVVEREEERRAFVPEEYWLLKAIFAGSTPPSFRAELWKVSGKKPQIPNAESANALEESIRGYPSKVFSVDKKERSRSPLPPFITASLQQAANQRLGYSAKKTMSVAQRLYEGIDLGEQGMTALITYMRTDSVRIAHEAQDAAAAWIQEHFGKEYLAPGGRRNFKAKSDAQDAHEAIRPVNISLTPDSIKDRLESDQFQIYKMIWTRFVASQMAAAKFYDTTVVVECGSTQWRAKGERLLFPGFLALSPQPKDADTVELPELAKDDLVEMKELLKEQKFTQPAPRFSEASLVRELEELGIGRPSTYATIISTLQDRGYVTLEEKHFVPTDMGVVVCKQLRENFTKLMDVSFTAKMEKSLDKVAEGDQNWVALLKNFSQEFNPALDAAAKNMVRVNQGLATGLSCPQCGSPLVIKFGKAGQFLACSKYPDCTFTSNYVRDESGQIQIQEKVKPELQKVGVCPECGQDLVVRLSHTGSRFIACTGYPKCKYAAPFSTGIPCPREGCTGTLVEKSSRKRKGKIFYSCSNYPQCDFAIWDKPVKESCPKCGFPFLVEKKKRDGTFLACPQKTCGYSRSIDEEKEETSH